MMFCTDLCLAFFFLDIYDTNWDVCPVKIPLNSDNTGHSILGPIK